MKMPLVLARYLQNQLMYLLNFASNLTFPTIGHPLNMANILLRNNLAGSQHWATWKRLLRRTRSWCRFSDTLSAHSSANCSTSCSLACGMTTVIWQVSNTRPNQTMVVEGGGAVLCTISCKMRCCSVSRSCMKWCCVVPQSLAIPPKSFMHISVVIPSSLSTWTTWVVTSWKQAAAHLRRKSKLTSMKYLHCAFRQTGGQLSCSRGSWQRDTVKDDQIWKHYLHLREEEQHLTNGIV